MFTVKTQPTISSFSLSKTHKCSLQFRTQSQRLSAEEKSIQKKKKNSTHTLKFDTKPMHEANQKPTKVSDLIRSARASAWEKKTTTTKTKTKPVKLWRSSCCVPWKPRRRSSPDWPILTAPTPCPNHHQSSRKNYQKKMDKALDARDHVISGWKK